MESAGIGRLTKTWEVSALNRETNEWTTALNHSYEHKPELPIEPVVAAEIHGSRKRPRTRTHERIMVVSDAQIGYRRIEDKLVPMHDESAIAVVNMLANYLRPDVVVDCGDTTDLAELGRWDADSDHFQGTLQPSLQRTHEFFAELTANTPGAERHTVDSNHAKRLGTYVLKHAMPLYNVKSVGEKYPALSYPSLVKIDEAGWQFHGGYGNAEYEYADDLAFKHGTLALSGGRTPIKLAQENPDRHMVQGHVHKAASHYQTDRKGNVFSAHTVGALCDRFGTVPSFHSAVDQFNQPTRVAEPWQNTIMIIDAYGNGRYNFQHVPIADGMAFFEGKVYNGYHEQLPVLHRVSEKEA